MLGPVPPRSGFRTLGLLDGAPVGTGGCEVAGDVARLYGAGTLPEARRQGVYRQVVRSRMALAREAGATLALVHGKADTSQPILSRLGFTGYGRGRLIVVPVGGAV